MTPQELAILGTALFLITVAISFFIQWQRKRSTSADAGNQPPEWDWYDIAELARTAVKDAEQLWLKEGLPKQARLDHAISILVQAYPQLADYKPIATAFIREVIFNMNHPEQPAPAPTSFPHVLPVPDKPIASR